MRDKIAASKRKGLWVGGPVPFGYRCIDKKLEIVPEEAEVVCTIFTRYLELGSMGALLTALDRQGIRTKINGRRDGRRSGGIRFGVGSLAHLLKNRSQRVKRTSSRHRNSIARRDHLPRDQILPDAKMLQRALSLGTPELVRWHLYIAETVGLNASLH